MSSGVGEGVVTGSSASLVEQAIRQIRRQWGDVPRLAVVLGTGLGDLVSRIDADVVIPYDNLPGFPKSTALSHAGQLVCGQLAGVPLVAMQGRCHLYEGYSYEDVTRPIRVMHALGANVLVATNASGGMNPKLRGGDILVLEGHVNLMGKRGWPERLPAANVLACRTGASPYDPELMRLALETSRRENFPCSLGVYAAVSGPNYETRAEYRFLRQCADVVGMSTVPEVETAHACGMRVLALSMVTNVARPDVPKVVTPQHVVDVASRAEPRLRQIVVSTAVALGDG